MEDNEMRKFIWARAAVVEERIAEDGFMEKSKDEQDVIVIAAQLDIEVEEARRFLSGEMEAAGSRRLRKLVADMFRLGKRKAVRHLRAALAHYDIGEAE